MNTLVVGHYQEPLDWLTTLPAGWKPLVVTKDVHVPNEGREPASYLWAIERAYRRLGNGSVWAFVQGNPFDHCPTVLSELEQGATSFRWLGDATYNSGPDGSPHHGGLPVREKYEAWTGREWPGFVTFAAGGQFVVTGRELRGRPAKFWRSLHAECLVDQVPWVLERLWEAVLTS